ncbi:MAG: hypothetical protein NT040_18105 [Bacteroidetes bacterium]|nr:hypothetical protein [Bacteroidota bacterium]
MKTLFISLLVILSFVVIAQDAEYSIKKDNIDPNKVNMVDSYGNVVRYYKPDNIDQNKINIFNANDQIIGYLKPDPLNSEILNVYTVNSEYVSTFKTNNIINTGHLYSTGTQFKASEELNNLDEAITKKIINNQKGQRPPDISMKYPVSTDKNFNIFSTNDPNKLSVYDANGKHIGDYVRGKGMDFWVYFRLHEE